VYKIIKITPILLLASILFVNVHAAQMYSSEVVGVQFSQTPYPGDFKMMVLNTQKPGGKVVIHVTSADKKMIAFDESQTEKSLVSEYILNSGKKVPVKDGIVDVWPFVSFSENNKAALIELHYKEFPPVSANSLQTQGQIRMKVANKQVPVERKKVKLEAGEKLAVGPVNLVVHKIDKPQWNKEYPVEVTFSTDEKFKQIAEISFFDGKGQPIKSSRGSTMSMGFGDKKQVQAGYLLKRNVKQVNIKAVYWDGVETVNVPLSITIQRPF
jgi:hypothetical protein